MSELRDRLQTERQRTWNQAKALLDHAEEQKRGLTGTEEAEYRAITADLNVLGERIKKIDADERNDAEANDALRNLMGTKAARDFRSTEDRELDTKLRRIIDHRSNEPIEIDIPAEEMRSGFQPGIEKRDLATTSGSGLLGTSFYSILQRHLVETSSILSAGATVLRSDTGEPIKIPKSTAFSTAAIVAEGGTIAESDPGLGTITLGGYKYAFRVEVTHELANDSNFDLVGHLAKNAGIAIGNGFGANAITGTGTGQPTGILTGATLGVTGPTGTATSLGAQTTVGQGGDLLHDLVASLAEPYARSAAAAWLMKNSTLNIIRKLRDSTGNYVFSADVIPGSGSAGTLLGRPVYTDPTMPAMAANAKSILFGDISAYWVRQVGGLRFERSEDFAHDRDVISFRAISRLDSALVDTTGAVKYFQNSAT
ncbi:phage major capsid protein [Agromyces sp. NPDC056965]|uniref:phage major capsid protein n=1 Tax=Agromyces sp. NPDC056965 TaxID=3345983 RepID=UPI003633D54C